MEKTVRTIAGNYLQTVLLERLTYEMKEFTTLNEKFGIMANTYPNVGEIPAARYFAIGNGGHTFTAGAAGRYKPELFQHLPDHLALFNQLPFVLRETTNDLTAVQRQNYGLRRAETHNGVNYIAYYLRRIDMTGVKAEMLSKKIVDGVATVTPFIPTSANLNPQPPLLSPSGVNVTTGDYLTASAKTPVKMTPFEIAELINVANILYADPGMAIISELAVVSGIDRVIQVADSGQVPFAFTEVIAAQIVTHIQQFYVAQFNNEGIDQTLDVGATEPLFLYE